MTQHFVSVPMPWPAPPLVAQTHDLIDAFHQELDGTTGGEPLSNAIVMACDVLTEHHGDEASWEQFDLKDFFAHILAVAPHFIPYCPRFKTTLVAFLAFLVRRNIVSAEVAARAELVAAPSPNRAARRRARAIARRAGSRSPARNGAQCSFRATSCES